MIEVVIRHKGSNTELGRIEIENVSNRGYEADYSVRYMVERVKGIGIHQRPMMSFPRAQYNVLALLLQALNTLSEDELRLDDPPDNLPKRKRLPWRGN